MHLLAVVLLAYTASTNAFTAPAVINTLYLKRRFHARGPHYFGRPIAPSLKNRIALELHAEPEKKSNLPMLIDPGTKGGSLFLSLVLFLLPIGLYNFLIATQPSSDPLVLGKYIRYGGANR